MHIASAKDRNPIYAKMSYYGVIERIFELDYINFRVPVFSYKWDDNDNGVRIDEFGFTLVDLNKTGYIDEPFILASQATQVFYVNDPSDKKWSVVMLAHKGGECDEYENEFEGDDSSFPEHTNGDNNNTDDIDYYIRNDHREGIWVNSSTSRLKSQHHQTSANPLGKRKR